ncbi:cytochrome c-550 PedF, partial [Paraburkholderia sp. SIMBA_027]
MTTKRNALLVAGLLVGVIGAGSALAHGNVVPQAVETKGLTSIKDAGVVVDADGWAAVNPYRTSPEHDKAVEIGASAYNQN